MLKWYHQELLFGSLESIWFNILCFSIQKLVGNIIRSKRRENMFMIFVIIVYAYCIM